MTSSSLSSSPSSTKKVVVFGSTGVIGTSLIELLSSQQPTWTILAVSRSANTASPESRLAALSLSNVQLVQGDVEDLPRVQELCTPSDVHMVYCCIGFPQYERKYWAEHWPTVVNHLLSVTSATTPLVFCDNLYAYGPTTDISPSTTTPVEPSLTSKPGIRATLRQAFVERVEASPQSLVVVGGADFFGPHVTSTSFLGDVFFGNLCVQQQKPLVIGSGNVLHDFCFAPDFARALYVVSMEPAKSMGKFWICPHSIHGKTMRQIATDGSDLIHAMDESNKKIAGVSTMPAFVVKVLGLFMSFMSEMNEMLPFWTNDYSVDDSDFVQTFGVNATPYEEALQATIDFFHSLK